MSQIARQKLVELTTRFGQKVIQDVRRCEALLNDLCENRCSGEVHVLVCALRDGVADELTAWNKGATPKGVFFARLAARLHAKYLITETAARWSVESWAQALGVASRDEVPALAGEDRNRIQSAPNTCDTERVGPTREAQQKLVDLTIRFGQNVIEDVRRCEVLLKDLCEKEFPGEFHTLVCALRDGIAAELTAWNEGATPKGVLFARLAARLHANYFITETAARWSIESWALALGVASRDEVLALAGEDANPILLALSTCEAEDIVSTWKANPLARSALVLECRHIIAEAIRVVEAKEPRLRESDADVDRTKPSSKVRMPLPSPAAEFRSLPGRCAIELPDVPKLPLSDRLLGLFSETTTCKAHQRIVEAVSDLRGKIQRLKDLRDSYEKTRGEITQEYQGVVEIDMAACAANFLENIDAKCSKADQEYDALIAQEIGTKRKQVAQYASYWHSEELKKFQIRQWGWKNERPDLDATLNKFPNKERECAQRYRNMEEERKAEHSQDKQRRQEAFRKRREECETATNQELALVETRIRALDADIEKAEASARQTVLRRRLDTARIDDNPCRIFIGQQATTSALYARRLAAEGIFTAADFVDVRDTDGRIMKSSGCYNTTQVFYSFPTPLTKQLREWRETVVREIELQMSSGELATEVAVELARTAGKLLAERQAAEHEAVLIRQNKRDILSRLAKEEKEKDDEAETKDREEKDKQAQNEKEEQAELQKEKTSRVEEIMAVQRKLDADRKKRIDEIETKQSRHMKTHEEDMRKVTEKYDRKHATLQERLHNETASERVQCDKIMEPLMGRLSELRAQCDRRYAEDSRKERLLSHEIDAFKARVEDLIREYTLKFLSRPGDSKPIV